MRKVFIVVSVLVMLVTIIGFGFLEYDSSRFETNEDDLFDMQGLFLMIGGILLLLLLFEFTISHGILYFTSFEWKTKLKDVLNGVSMALVAVLVVIGSIVEEVVFVGLPALILITLVYFVIVIVERSRALSDKIKQRKNAENSQVYP